MYTLSDDTSRQNCGEKEIQGDREQHTNIFTKQTNKTGATVSMILAYIFFFLYFACVPMALSL